MRTLAEYQDTFSSIEDKVLSSPYETRAEARHLVAVANSEVRKARDVFTREITFDWKEGFKKLKAENDQMQRDLKKAFDDEMQMISERLGDMLEVL